MDMTKGIHIFEQPLDIDKYEFLLQHIGCDCIAKRERSNPIIKVLAYAIKPKYNRELEKYYVQMKYDGSVRLIQGIDKSEVDAID